MPVEFDLVKISQLPPAGGVSDGDEIPINQSGQTYRIRKDVLAASIAAPVVAGLTVVEVEVTGSDQIVVQADKLLFAAVVVGDTDTVIKVGITEDGDEIFEDIIAVDGHIVQSRMYFFQTTTDVWLTGTGLYRLYFAG